MCPISPCSRWWQYQSTHSAVASSTSESVFQGRRGLSQLSLEQPDRRLHQGIVVGVADRSDRRGDARSVEVLGERERRVLRPGIAVVYQLAFLIRVLVSVALPQGHLQGVEEKPCLLRCGRGPADDAAGEGVHDEGDVDDAG